MEAYTCPCVRYHPFDPHFVAQSNGNYIAIFSSSPPYKLNKYKRYESHGVSGFPIKCSFSLDGEKLVSGSSDGSMYFYDYKSSKLVKKIKAHEQACIDIAVHPILTNVIASCSWNGEVSVFEWLNMIQYEAVLRMEKDCSAISYTWLWRQSDHGRKKLELSQFISMPFGLLVPLMFLLICLFSSWVKRRQLVSAYDTFLGPRSGLL